MKFLYWNINKQISPFEDYLQKLMIDRKIDVLILSENKNISNEKILKNIDFEVVKLEMQNSTLKWVQVYYKKNAGFKITHHSEDTDLENIDNTNDRLVNRIQVFKISNETPSNILDTYFACIHFPSKLYHDEISHLQIVPNYKAKVHNLTQNSARVFIVGDFNMNPFDYGMVEPNGFFAHNNRELVDVDAKIKHGNKQILYYNPCWILLGDYVNKTNYKTNNRTGGSFFYEGEKSRSLYWYLIDQIIMRKALIDGFVSEDLEIIEDPQMREDIQKEKTKDINKIDHFPLQFSFNF